MKKTIRNILLCLFLSALPLQAAFASYGIYLKNNSLDTIKSTNVCNGFWFKDICKPHNYAAIPLYSLKLLTTINYDYGIKNSQNYIFDSHFITPNGDNGNFVRFTVHGDFIGSHFSSIDAYVNGQWSNLLNSNNDSDKVLPYKLGSKTYLDNTGKKYTISVVGTKENYSDQGIDNIEMELTRFPVSALDKQNGASLDKHNGASLDKQNGASLDKQNGASLDKHNGVSLDKHNGVSLDKHNGASLDKHNGASLDKHNGASLDEHNGASLSK